MSTPFLNSFITKEKLLSCLDARWFRWIPDLREKPYWEDIVVGINTSITHGLLVVPNLELIFKALNSFQPNNFRVLVIGQDPYPTIGHATGFSFSVAKDKKIPATLSRIFEEIDGEYGSDMRKSNEFNGDLEAWSKQGVLLLNAVLTIGISKYKCPKQNYNESHNKIGWFDFIQDILNWLDSNYKFVTLALGSFAKKTTEFLSKNLTNIVVAPHPSPLNISRKFLGCKCFRECNNKLMAIGLLPIKWVF